MIKMPYLSKHHRFTLSGIKGFSLLEMLIYISILVLLLIVIMNIVISVVRSGRIINALRNVENSALISLERITRETRQADSMDTGGSILDSNPGRLVLESVEYSGIGGTLCTVEFYLSSGTLMFSENGVEIGPLTQGDAKVSSLIFRRFSSLNSEGIRTEITLESGTSTYYRSNNFYSSATLR